MASYIKTLKEDNGDITYPQTLASAVITAGGSDVDSALATKANSADLAAVATSGLYSDLSGTPSLATVATSGSYSDLSNKPTIPAAQIQSDWSQSTSTAVDYIKNKPGIKNATAATHTDYNNNQDYLPNMRFLSFWNGAYNSGGSSNLKYFASNSVTTSNLQDGAVTTAKIAGTAVTSAKIDWGNCRSYGSGSYNTSYFSGGRIQYVKYGNMVTVTVSDLALKATPPNSTNQTTAITGLPQSASWMQNCTFNFTIYGNNTKPLTLRMDASKTAFYFHYTNGTGSSGTFNGQFTYPAA